MSADRSIGTAAVGFGGEPARYRKRPDLCATEGHPGCTYNQALNKTWCLCGEVVAEGNTAVPHVACCGGPLEEDTHSTLACESCGNPFAPGTADEGCPPCALCVTCTPAACNCKEGRALRREDQADWLLRVSKEARTW